ncbi:MAG TPA: ATP synthase F0 subunit B [Candidatus Paceibacterota bacterium]
MSHLLEAFGLNGKLLLAQVVNMGILLAALTYFLYKPLMRSLDARQKLMAQGVEDAQRAAEKLATADDAATKRVTDAESQAEGIVLSARETAQAERTRIVKEAEDRATALMTDAEMRAKENAAKTMRESEKEIARLAILAAEKTLRAK